MSDWNSKDNWIATS